jgi:hypothetical protein
MGTEGTVIIDFVIESEANVYPMVAPGSAITNMIEEKPEESTQHDSVSSHTSNDAGASIFAPQKSGDVK